MEFEVYLAPEDGAGFMASATFCDRVRVRFTVNRYTGGGVRHLVILDGLSFLHESWWDYLREHSVATRQELEAAATVLRQTYPAGHGGEAIDSSFQTVYGGGRFQFITPQGDPRPLDCLAAQARMAFDRLSEAILADRLTVEAALVRLVEIDDRRTPGLRELVARIQEEMER